MAIIVPITDIDVWTLSLLASLTGHFFSSLWGLELDLQRTVPGD